MKRELQERAMSRVQDERRIPAEAGGGPWQAGRGRMDAGLLVVLFILVSFGLVMLFSASMNLGYALSENPTSYILRQGIFSALGLAVALLIAFLGIRWLDRIALAAGVFAVTTLLLVLVLFTEEGRYGGRRWFELPMGLGFQPTELAKVAMIYCYAVYRSWLRKRRTAGGFRTRRGAVAQAFLDGILDLFIPLACLALWIGLIVLEPHFSCVVILLGLALVMALTTRIRIASLLAGLTLSGLAGGGLFLAIRAALPVLPASFAKYLDFQYALDRLRIFFTPDQATPDELLQLQQSIRAIGSGGLTGVGLGLGRQKYGYLPMSHNDYIFSVIGEELGFVGSMLVLLLFLFLLARGLTVAGRARSPLGLHLAAGTSVLIVLQAYLNVAVATNLLPPTGISLPFFSYGGTSNLFFLAAMGLLLAVSRTLPAAGARTPAGRRP